MLACRGRARLRSHSATGAAPGRCPARAWSCYSASAPVAQVDRQAYVRAARRQPKHARGADVAEAIPRPVGAPTPKLQDLTAHVEPNHDNMFLIAVKSKQRDASAIDSNGIVVALRSCSLRDQWLQALVIARVDVTGCWQPSADMTAIRPTDSLCHGSWSDAPVRWLR